MIDKWQTFIFTSGSQDLVLDALDTFCVEGGTLISSRSSCNVRCANTFYIVLSTISWIRCVMSWGLCAFVAEHFSVYVLFVLCRWVSQWQTIVWWAVSGEGGGCNHFAIHEDGPCSWEDRRDVFPLAVMCITNQVKRLNEHWEALLKAEWFSRKNFD